MVNEYICTCHKNTLPLIIKKSGPYNGIPSLKWKRLSLVLVAFKFKSEVVMMTKKERRRPYGDTKTLVKVDLIIWYRFYWQGFAGMSRNFSHKRRKIFYN